MHLLKQLTDLVTTLAKSTETVKSLVTDERLQQDTVGAMKEFVGPVTNTVKQVAANVIEAKDRAEESQEVIGIFPFLKRLSTSFCRECKEIIWER